MKNLCAQRAEQETAPLLTGSAATSPQSPAPPPNHRPPLSWLVYTVCLAFLPLSCRSCALRRPSLDLRRALMVSTQLKPFLAPQLLGEMPEPRDVAVAALHLSLKPAFVPCTFLARSNLAALPISQLWPSILDQGHARQVLDTMCQPSCDLLPRHTCRRNA
jgi:hypothetical protein